MKKKFKCEVDCADCAARMTDAIKKVEGVIDANVNFLTQKLMIEAEESRFDEIVQLAIKACKKVEPDCEVYVD